MNYQERHCDWAERQIQQKQKNKFITKAEIWFKSGWNLPHYLYFKVASFTWKILQKNTENSCPSTESFCNSL